MHVFHPCCCPRPQGNAEKALHYIHQIDGYADNSGYIDIFEFNAFFDYYGGEDSPQALEVLETLEAHAKEFQKIVDERTEAEQAAEEERKAQVRAKIKHDKAEKAKTREKPWDKRVRKQYEWLNEVRNY